MGLSQVDAGAAADRFTATQRRHWERKRRFLDPRAPGPEAFVRPKLAWVLDQLAVDSTTSVLDVGAGNGTFTWYWAERAGHVVGVDFSRNLLRRSPCRSSMAQADAARLPFRDRQFDVVAESNFLHHVSDPVVILKEMARVARRHVVLVEPNRWHLPMTLFMALHRPDWRGLRFDRGHVARLANRAGLRLAAAEAQGAIYPNQTPARLVGPLARFDRPSRMGAYVVAVLENP